MGRLFKRQAELTLASVMPNAFFRLDTNAVVIRDLRFKFKVTKKLGEKPNNAEIMIYNLAERTRAAFQIRPLNVRLDVGYDGNLGRIFTGDVRQATSVLTGVDWETTIEAGDGERAYRYARANRSYKSGVRVDTVLGDLAKTMDVRLPSTLGEAKELTKQFASGVTLQGPSAAEMTRILKSKGYDWSIQDGRLQILTDSGVRPDQAIVISQDTGMLGVPELGAPAKKGEPPRLRCRALIDDQKTSLVCGGLIQVVSRAIKGAFKVDSIEYTGDTRGPDWYCDMEGVPV